MKPAKYRMAIVACLWAVSNCDKAKKLVEAMQDMAQRKATGVCGVQIPAGLLG